MNDYKSEPSNYEKKLATQPLRALHSWEGAILVILAAAANLRYDLTSPNALDGFRVRDMLDGWHGVDPFCYSFEGQMRYSFRSR